MQLQLLMLPQGRSLGETLVDSTRFGRQLLSQEKHYLFVLFAFFFPCSFSPGWENRVMY